MLEVALSDSQQYAVASSKFSVAPGKKYSVSTKVTGISGQPQCAFFGVVLFKRDNQELVERKIQWLEDFSGKEKEYQIVFEAPEECENVKMIYRINKRTPAKAACKFRITPIDQIKLQEEPGSSKNAEVHTENKTIEELTLEQEDRLERNLVWTLYYPNKTMESVAESLFTTTASTEILNKPLIGSLLTNTRKMSHTYVRDIDYRASRRNYFFNYKYIHTWKFYLRRLILNRIYAQFRNLTSTIIVNDPDGAMVADLLIECFPNSKLLFMPHDGRTLLASKRKGGKKSVSTEEKSFSRDAELWRISMTTALHAYERHPKNLRLMVKYEEVSKDPAKSIDKIYDFLGAKPDMGNDIQKILTEVNENIQNSELKDSTKYTDPKNWKEQFSEDQMHVVQKIMSQVLLKLEYVKPEEIAVNKQTGIFSKDKNELEKIWEKKYDSFEIDPIPPATLTPEQEDRLERNLVWIMSNPRSGTTWLGTELLAHGTRVWNEPLIGTHLVNLKDTGGFYERDIDTKARRRNFIFSEMYSPVWKHFVRKLILNRTYAQFQDLEKKIIIKEPNGSMAADVICECLPNSKMIVLLRDGRDTVDSRLNALIKGGWGTKFFGENSRDPLTDDERPKVIRTRSMLWRVDMETVLKAYEKHRPENRIMLKYEELRKNTFEEAKKIYQFVGVSISDKKLKQIIEKYTFENLPDSEKGSGKRVRSASPGKWRDSFSEEEKKMMHDIMGDMLEKLGYLSKA